MMSLDLAAHDTADPTGDVRHSKSKETEMGDKGPGSKSKTKKKGTKAATKKKGPPRHPAPDAPFED